MGKRQTITIDKVVAGGLGLGRLASGLVVMVPLVLPGETVRVALGRERKGFAEASLVEVLSPSPQRVEPVCPHFGRCGGCQLQHATYAEQLAIKAAILSEILGRHGGLDRAAIPESSWQPVLASPEPLHYRQRIRLQVDDWGRLGFFAAQSHTVVEVDNCLLAAGILNRALGTLPTLGAFQALAAKAEAVELLHSPLDGRLVVIVHLRRKPRPADQQAARSLAADLMPATAVWLAGAGFARQGPYGAAEGLSGDIGFALGSAAPFGRPLTLRFPAGGFCQVNLAQNEALIRQLLDWAAIGDQDSVLDLFCGMGNFSLPLALSARRVVASDLQRSSIRGAEANALANALDNCRFLRAAAGTTVEELLATGERFDCVLLDPPRAGCRDIIPRLSALEARRLVYVSCDPATLARDLLALTEAGFCLRRIRGVDMFPQTCHLETIALLTRES